MNFKKLRNNTGSAMLLSIFLMVIVSIIIISFSTQVGNQVKSTMKADEEIQEKYDAESEIEEGIAEFIKGINVVYVDGSSNYDIEYLESIEHEDVSISLNKIGLDTTFTLIFRESEPTKTSEIDIKVTNISGNVNGQEKCQISYEVKSWRS